MKPQALPVYAVLDELAQALAHSNAILHAPPGAGKTTVVPLALYRAQWLNDARIVMLEPRRLAARAAAARLAASLGEKPGQTVGYRMRMDASVGPATRILVVTEGILTRMLQSDPALEGIGLVIFDEFHERSLHADLGLAFSLESQAALRPDLRILVMSATLQATPLANLLGGAPVIECHGRSFPVATRYRPSARDLPVATAAATAARDSLADTQGDLLVFLPGAAAIRSAERQLAAFERAGTLDDGTDCQLSIAPLYGELDEAAQQVAIAPATAGRRKIVLATNIAESSLTIDGVRCVIDAGLHNSPVFDPATGMSRLVTQRISRASADQRRGRAGRTAPGMCIRLWSETVHQRLAPFDDARILHDDLAPLALEIALWGARDVADLAWLDPPPPAAWARARQLLRQLGATDRDNRITAHGRAMAALGVHPRLGHMLVTARELGAGAVAADIAALLSERDILHYPSGAGSADLDDRLSVLHDTNALPAGSSLRRGALRRVKALASRWKRLLGSQASEHCRESISTGLLVAIAYPDRIAAQRAGRRHCYKLSSGKGACLRRGDALAAHTWLAVAAADAGTADGRIYLAASVDPKDLEAHFANLLTTDAVVRWDEAAGAVVAAETTRIGAVVFSERPLVSPPQAQVTEALIVGIRRAGLSVLPWSDSSHSLRKRVNWLSQLQPAPGGLEWPEMSEERLLQSLEQWLAHELDGMSRLSHLKKLNLKAALNSLLQARHHAALDRLAPRSVTVPSGSKIRLDYDVNTAQGETPILRVRLQEMFGLSQSPRIADGQVPLTVHLLSPAGRPVQVTRDMASFWRTTYAEVCRDLKGRYPKHYWPDDPLNAVATRRVRPRGRA